MTVDEAMKKIWEVFPDAEVCYDQNGQLVIYTGVRADGDSLVPFNPEDT